MQSVAFEGTSMDRSCAYTTVVNIIVLSVGGLGHVFISDKSITVLTAEELGHVFTRSRNMIANCANQAGKARLAQVMAAAWAVCA